MAYFKWAFIAAIALSSSACVREGDEFIVPLGHPADAGAQRGAVLVSSSALEPELETVKPAPAAGSFQHKH